MPSHPEPQPEPTAWWRSAAIYQVYPRSFSDGNGDGVGDLIGIRSHLGYLRDLGVDALWFSPWYPSPMADAGYDVADYRDIDPAFGTLAEAEQLIAEAHAVGLRVIIDIVPNHCSDQHPLFQAALRAGRGSPERELFWFFDEPVNDWSSHFGGNAPSSNGRLCSCAYRASTSSDGAATFCTRTSTGLPMASAICAAASAAVKPIMPLPSVSRFEISTTGPFTSCSASRTPPTRKMGSRLV